MSLTPNARKLREKTSQHAPIYPAKRGGIADAKVTLVAFAQVNRRRRARVLQSVQAFTLLDLLVGLCCLVVIVTVGWSVLMTRSRTRCCQINCSNNMKQIGLTFKTWSLDNQDLYPMQVSVTNGGTMELVSSGAAWVHFRVTATALRMALIRSGVATNRLAVP